MDESMGEYFRGARRVSRKLIALLACAASAPHVAAAPPSGSEAPDFALKSTAGENLRLSEYRGEVVLLSFFAAWCSDCRAQASALSELHERYRDAGLELLGVSLDQSMRQASDTAAALDVAYPVLHDAGGSVGRLYDIERMPVVVVIDRSGVVRDVLQGYRRGATDYVERVQALLRE
jgi:peroxiredoxin